MRHIPETTKGLAKLRSRAGFLLGIMHYECGRAKVRAAWNGRMRLAASAFNTVYDNYQDAAWVGGQFTFDNAEQAKLEGAEVEGEMLLGERLSQLAPYLQQSKLFRTHDRLGPTTHVERRENVLEVCLDRLERKVDRPGDCFVRLARSN